MFYSNVPLVYLGWEMNELTRWSHSYEPNHQIEPVPMFDLDTIVDARDGVYWRDHLERNSLSHLGSTGCLAMAQNGLIMPTYNYTCEQPLEGLCEYRGQQLVLIVK